MGNSCGRRASSITPKRILLVHTLPSTTLSGSGHPRKEKKIQELLASKGIDLEAMKADQHMSDVDDFDFICHVAFDKKPLTRKERANNVKKRDFLSKYSGVAREVLEALLEQYMNVGIYELEHEAILTTPQFAKFGKIQRIFKFFGGEDKYNEAVHELENELYEAG